MDTIFYNSPSYQGFLTSTFPIPYSTWICHAMGSVFYPPVVLIGNGLVLVMFIMPGDQATKARGETEQYTWYQAR